MQIVDRFDHDKLIVSERDNGIYDALNKGLRRATGDIIGCLHSDDLYPTADVLELVVRAFESSDANIVYGDLSYVSRDKTKVFRRWTSRPMTPKLLRRGWMPPHPAMYVSREIAERVGEYRTDLSIAADYDFIIRCFQHPQARPTYISRTLSHMRVGGASNRSIRNILQKSREDVRVMKDNGVTWLPAILMKNITKLPQLFRAR